MKAKLILALALAVTFFSCSEDEIPAKPSVWGIAYSEPVATTLAGGIIEQETEGPHITYAVDIAYLLGGERGDSLHTLTYIFTSKDSLRIGFIKVNEEANFRYPAGAGENRLQYAVFNNDTLDLYESSVYIQPRTGENKVATNLNLASRNAGAFTGTVSSVPLVRNP